jgi:selenide,water dikinase
MQEHGIPGQPATVEWHPSIRESAMNDIASLDAESPQAVRLTQQTRAGGCASKLAPGSLNTVLSRLPVQRHPDLLVGYDTADDAGVFRIGRAQALVQTVDFFTPMVDDPFTFGRIAATNALSDVYAMGGYPLTALSIVCFPADGDLRILEEILRGGMQTMGEAGCIVLGGHSVRDSEIKFGYAVTGLVGPDAVLTNAGARPGNRLIFAKALGTGVIATALKAGCAQQKWIDGAIGSMTMLNRRAAEAVLRYAPGIQAMTDVTGFGLMGHARELALGSKVRLTIRPEAVPILEGALECVAMGCIPAGLRANLDFAGCIVEQAQGSHLPDDLRMLLFDPQTAGGLLIAAEPRVTDSLVSDLRAEGYPAAEIGRVAEGEPRIVLC